MEETIHVELSRAEAWDIFSRVLNSNEPDSSESREAMRKLANALREAPETTSCLRLAS